MTRIFLQIIISCLLYSCAQFVPPTGGPKDEDPPILLESYPKNETLNFKEREITLLFNELIDASKVRQELTITPEPPGSFEVKSKNYEVILKFDTDFADSTTYTLNFREGIKDLSEKNPAENLKLVFSTGDIIDSLRINGNIKYLWTGAPAEKATVALYSTTTNDTIPLLKRKPDYFINTDTSGNYQFENLKSSSYRILSFVDKNSNLLFDQKNEVFAFLPDTLNLIDDTTSLNMMLYPHNWEVMRIRKKLSRINNYEVTYSKNIDSTEITFLSNDSLTYKINKDVLTFFKHPIPKDTVLTKLIVTDSLGQLSIDTLAISFKEPFNDKPYEPTKLKISIEPDRKQSVDFPLQYELQFDETITTFNPQSINIQGDTTYTLDFTTKWIDPQQTKLLISPSPPYPQREIKLSIDNGALSNYKSDTNDTYTLIHKVYPQENYGLLAGQFECDTCHYIVQLIDSKTLEVTDSQIFNAAFTFPQVRAGEYYLRCILDNNKNKRWDPGHFQTNQPPEPIYIYPQLIRIKPNFEIRGIEIKL